MSDDDSAKTRERFLMWPPQPSPHDSPPPGPEVEATFGARSRRGPLRFQNDDHYMVSRLGKYRDTLLTSLSDDDVARRFDEWMYGMVVADGLGSGGETASRLAVSTLVHLSLSFGRWHVRIDEPIAEEVMDRVDRFYRAVDTTLLQAGQENSRVLQSTLTAVVTAGSDLFFAHVGHSRAYLFRHDELIQLTRDHINGQEQLRREDQRRHRQWHARREARGDRGTRPRARRLPADRHRAVCVLLHGDVVFLCTNGLTDVVDDDRISGGAAAARHNGRSVPRPDRSGCWCRGSGRRDRDRGALSNSGVNRW